MTNELLKLIGELQILALCANESEDHNIYFEFAGHVWHLQLRVEDRGTNEETFNEYLFIESEKDIFKKLNNWIKVLQAVIIPDIDFEIETLKAKQS
ncbi:MAG: hypothetical protein PF694_09115 [Bacteroidetes bacterium]|jgi:hypothetical protein|nr:hypothetical protein [Bacteroidota bacterium]